MYGATYAYSCASSVASIASGVGPQKQLPGGRFTHGRQISFNTSRAHCAKHAQTRKAAQHTVLAAIGTLAVRVIRTLVSRKVVAALGASLRALGAKRRAVVVAERHEATLVWRRPWLALLTNHLIQIDSPLCAGVGRIAVRVLFGDARPDGARWRGRGVWRPCAVSRIVVRIVVRMNRRSDVWWSGMRRWRRRSILILHHRDPQNHR